MKNWKFIKVGNSDKEFKSEQELRRWAIDHQYTYKPTHGGYYMLEDDSGKGREPIEAHVSQPVVNKTGNKKTGNKRYFSVEEEGGDSRSFQSLSEAKSFADKWRSEGKQTVHIFEIEENDKDPDDFRVVRTINSSIEKQTWSMFKGLSKDAEKEIGNDEADLIKRGFVYKVNIPGKKPIYFNNPRQAQIAVESQNGTVEKVGNKKTGNAYTPNPELIKVLEAWLHNRISEQEARAKIMKITGDKNITDMMIHSPGGFIPAGNKKTGNNSIGDEYNAEIYRLEKKKMDLERMGQGQKAREIEKQIQQLQKELREYDIGNKKTGNEKISYPPEKLKDVSWVTLQYIIIHPEKYDEKTVELAKKIYANHIGNKKTGNQSEQERFLDDINGIKSKYKQEGKELNLSRLMYELKRIGWAESDFTKLKWPTNIGNTAHSDKVEVIKRLLAGGWSVEDIYSQLKTEGYEVEKSFIEKLKTGNAAVGAEVVAREVVEGKEYIVEKTSLRNGQDVQFNLYYSMDGSGKRHAGVFKDKDSAVSAGKKIVGNARPKEQLLADVRELTKYIQEHQGQNCEKEKRLLGEAKEELDKEYGVLVNNLKRARNSIKTKNSDVTLWNGNDTAYIKEDGHVQFLENNAFLVEEDKYDSQEKAVEDLTKKGYRKK